MVSKEDFEVNCLVQQVTKQHCNNKSQTLSRLYLRSSDQVFDVVRISKNNSIKLIDIQLQTLLNNQSCNTFYHEDEAFYHENEISDPYSFSVSFGILSNITTVFRCWNPPYLNQQWNLTPEKNSRNVKAILITTAVGVGVAILNVLGIVLIARCKKRIQDASYVRQRPDLEEMDSLKLATEDQDLEIFLKNHGSLTPKRYSYTEVNKMTNSFDTKLGQGGYGSVYRGKLQDGTVVAVKVLKESKGKGEEFINEVASISRTSHVNIVSLLGFCVQGLKKALIYEFMPNGSLEKFIYEEKASMNRQLEWQTLYNISVGIARGLEYLHRGCNTRILHFDIKRHNILLDENFCPKISDFGLAKLCTRKESIISTIAARGTIGYIAPEIVCKNIGGVSHKSDVYSYGMMVLEMVGGRKNVNVGADRTSEIYFPHWIYPRLCQGEELGLSGIKDEKENKQSRKMLIASLWCIQTNPSSRPTISEVLEMLEGPIEAMQMPPKPFLYDSPSRPALLEGFTNYCDSVVMFAS
ncbi:hypothetical protein M9H77_08376 [Catharanthus roseus]|uniref:Uncharacterized protein n=1 Tax=Catharanthus roseus TaxID=4058 RepID=A0ACC0BXY7_CATRO|nr:hypothetical protein M9H77_08376 [Catharanthus roseus]